MQFGCLFLRVYWSECFFPSDILVEKIGISFHFDRSSPIHSSLLIQRSLSSRLVEEIGKSSHLDRYSQYRNNHPCQFLRQSSMHHQLKSNYFMYRQFLIHSLVNLRLGFQMSIVEFRQMTSDILICFECLLILETWKNNFLFNLLLASILVR